ncbi:GDYXXLXY domain-containing protein [Tepidibacillus fermentans]|uniref:Putative membrane-anchored protein n=1 Tax=Tepidibacillus fermentans TaxID=1281767 RepID=A0A4R3KK87_9BACI|nr:GDYXXLXY domain-containing protein [Tepidibacillus fermentans]TCS83847.1 putative membrane-anchored protein [Tepidibacillus fermentans]
MRNRSTIFFYIVMIVPVLILLSMSFLPTMTYFFGEEILLKTKPLDPRDLFRGDYVSLRYEINDVPFNLFPEELKSGKEFSKFRDKDLYAILQRKGNFYTVEKISFTKPNHPYYLKAKVNLYGPLNEMSAQNVYVDYQIDRYFVPENTGEDLEKQAREGNLVAKVKVWHGYPLLMEVQKMP